MKHTYKAALLAVATPALAAAAAAQDNVAVGATTTSTGNTAGAATETTDILPYPVITTDPTGTVDATLRTDADISDPTVTNIESTDPAVMGFNATSEQYTQVQQEDEGFDWGLLGLLGLAGLLGLMKKDHHRARDIHVDARDTRT